MNSVDAHKSFKVVAAIDFSMQSPGVLRRALAIANLTPGSEVHVVSVTGEATAESTAKLLDAATAALKEWSDRGVELQIGRVLTNALAGKPAREVVWLAAYLDADLIIIGTRGWDGVSQRVLGDVTESVVRDAGCPVIVERPKHHEKLWTTPQIEPPCPDCVVAQRDSAGAEMWCARHREHHPHAHVYSWNGVSSAPAEPWGFRD